MYKESVGTALIPVEREGGCKTKITVKYETKDLTAVKGRDYSAPDKQEIVFDKGEVSKMIEICIRDDMVRTNIHHKDHSNSLTLFIS